MTTLVRMALVCGFVAAFSSAASAQDRKWGILFAYPGAVGVQWDVADRFAIRVDGDYDRSHSEFITGMGDPPPRVMPTIPGITVPTFIPVLVSTTSEITTHRGSIGVSGLFALVARDQLKIYVAPRAGVSMSSVTFRTTFDVSGIPPALLAAITLPANEERSESDYAPDFSAKFGAAYRLGDRFSVFGEAGFGYTGGVSTSNFNTEVRQNSIGLRSGIGGILYF